MNREIKIRQMIRTNAYEKRVSLKMLSKSTKIPYSTLFAWSEGRCPKDLIKAKRLADYFEISLDELIFGFDARKRESLKEVLSKNLKNWIDIFVKELDI